MTGGIEYKLWLDGNAVAAQFYPMIETITIEQGIDMATEARIELEMCADENGNWSGPTDPSAQTWKRVRIEVRNQTSDWIPLIDGPLVTWDASMSGEPGQSTFTLVAHDDTALLNVQAKIETFEGQTDKDVVTTLFNNVGITNLQLDTIPKQPDDRPLKHIKRSTEIEMLRSIAEPYDLHVYVKPDSVGKKSIGCVKRLRTSGDADVPALILNGPDRNVETFQARNDVANATRYQGEQLDIQNVTAAPKAVRSKWTNDDDGGPPIDATVSVVGPPVALLGDNVAIDSLDKLGTELLSPYACAFRDVTELVARMQQRSSYTITATGSVRYGCYHGVLRAYDMVAVSGVNAKLCSKYIVREVTHTLSRSEYRQDFTLMTNSTAKVSKAPGVPSGVL